MENKITNIDDFWYIENRKIYLYNKISKTSKKLNNLLDEKRYLDSKQEFLIDPTQYLESSKRDYIDITVSHLSNREESFYIKKKLLILNSKGILDDYIQNNPI